MPPKSTKPVKSLGLSAFDLDTPVSKSEATEIELSRIDITSHQSRRYISPEELDLMRRSIEEHGVITPILVSPNGDRFDLVYGQKRFKGSIAANRATIPAAIRELDRTQQMVLGLVENLHREDLNPIDEVDAILALMAVKLDVTPEVCQQILKDIYNREYEQKNLTTIVNTYPCVGLQTGVQINLDEAKTLYTSIGRIKVNSFVLKLLPLLKLPEEFIAAIRNKRIAYPKARIIARVKDVEFRTELLRLAIAEQLTRTEIESLVKAKKETRVEKVEIWTEEMLLDNVKSTLSRIGGIKKMPESKRKKLQRLLKEVDEIVAEHGSTQED